MITFFIDTSSDRLFTASFSDKQGFFSLVSAAQLSHDEEILQAYQRHISHNEQVHAVSRIVLGSGPGSFTGLRIGYSFVKGLVMASKLKGDCIEVYTVSSLQAGIFASLEALGVSLESHKVEGVSEDISLLAISNAGKEAYFSLRANSCNGFAEMPVEVIRSDHISSIDCSVLVCCDQTSCERAATFEGNAKKVICLPDLCKGMFNVLLAKQAVLFEGEISNLTPNYIRAVSAKTIAERGVIESEVI